MSKLIMKINDKITDEKLQYDIKREAAKISALSFGKIDKYKYLTGEEILHPKQMLQRLTIALEQVKAGNTSENLLNKIRQIIYSLHQEKEITKEVYKI